MTIRIDDWSKVELDHKECASMWHALMFDIGAEPCMWPDLRDSLHDWIKRREPVNGRASNE